MRRIVLTTTIAALLASATFAEAAFPDLTRIYRFSGAQVTATANGAGVQTVVQCTNWHWSSSAVVRVIVRNHNNLFSDRLDANIPKLSTVGFGTWETKAIPSVSMAVPFLTNAGSIEVWATRPQVHCEAFVLEAGFINPFFTLPLVGVRSAQEAGSQE